MLKRKLTAAVFTFGTLTAGLAGALGLGEATVRSSLNQPLVAEIALLNIGELSEREIISALASREEFLRADLERGFFLSDLRFKVELDNQGNGLIRVTSSRAVREPFLNFLVEVTWPTGRLMREYALLIDPPTYDEGQVLEAAPATLAAPADAPAQAPAAPIAAPDRAVSAGSVAPASQTEPSEYGPTSRNDTLWSIAMQVRPDQRISPQQMMLAIQAENPDAFLNNNINELLVGQTLSIPDASAALQRPFREAVAEVARQNAAFDEARLARTRPLDARSDEAVAERLNAARGQEQADRLRILTDGDDAVVAEDEVSGLGGEVAGTGTADRADTTAAESADSEMLQAEVEDLRAQLDTLERLLELKDAQIAALQQQAPDAVPAVPELSQPPVDEEIVAEAAASEASTDGAEAAVTEGPGEVTEPEESDIALLTPPAPAEEAFVADPDPVTQAPAAPPAPVPPQPVSAVDNFLDLLKNNLLVQIAVGLAAGLIALLALVFLRRKGQEEELPVTGDDLAADKLAISHGVGGDLDVPEDVEAFAGAEQESAETPADEGTDAIAEADVYLAYDRTDQAIRVLEDELQANPEHHDARLKLLEVAAVARNGGLFAQTLESLRNTGDAAVIGRANMIESEYGHLVGGADEGLSLDDLENQIKEEGLTGSSGPLLAEDSQTAEMAPSDADDLADFDIDFDLADIELDDSIESTSEPQKQKTQADADASRDLSEEASEGLQASLEEELDLAAREQEGDVAALEESLETDPGALEVSLEADPGALEASLEADLDTDLALDDLEVDEALESLQAPLEESGADIDPEEMPAADSIADDSPVHRSGRVPAPADELADPLEDELADLDAALDADLADLDAALDTDLPDLDENSASALAAELDADLAEDFAADLAGDELDATLEQGLDAEFAHETQALDDAADQTLADNLDLSDDLELSEELTALDETLADDDPVALTDEADINLELDAQAFESTAEADAEKPDSADLATAGGEAEPADPFVDDLEEDFDFLAGTDESATKLDLARAYIDMGDNEGARDILEEVVEEGSEAQQSEARGLLEGLG